MKVESGLFVLWSSDFPASCQIHSDKMSPESQLPLKKKKTTFYTSARADIM